MVLLAALAQGSINAVDVPARQSFVIEMVGRDDLLNAIALNSTIFNGSAVVGPSLAGLLIGLMGVAPCFLINSVSYLAAIVALALMHNLPALRAENQPQSALKRIGEGLNYARRDPVVATLLLNVAVFSLFSMNRLTILPVFADRVLHIGPAGFGFLTAAQGLGAVAGALSLATLQQRMAQGRAQFLIGLTWCVFLLGFSASRVVWISLLLLMGSGFCQIAFVSVANSRIQALTPDHLRGRVMALYAQSLIGVGPVGSLQAGALTQFLGAPWAMALGALVSGSFLVASRLLRPAVFRAGGTAGSAAGEVGLEESGHRQ
jgi:MFS family permease